MGEKELCALYSVFLFTCTRNLATFLVKHATVHTSPCLLPHQPCCLSSSDDLRTKHCVSSSFWELDVNVRISFRACSVTIATF